MGKLDNSKQSKAESFVDGWVETSRTFLFIAVIIIAGVIALTIAWSVVGPTKFLPKHPSRQDISNQHLADVIKHYHPPT
jgi:hypothetical protein